MLFLLLQANNPSVAWYKDPITVATIIIALAAIGSAVISERLRRVTAEYVQATKEYVKATQDMLNATQETMQLTKDNLRVTRDIYEAAHRPYVGIFEVNHGFQQQNTALLIELKYKNIGSVPAVELKAAVTFAVDGAPISDDSPVKDSVGVILPDQTLAARYTYYGDFNEALTGNIILTFTFSCSYKGVTQQEYRYEQESQYEHHFKGFYIIKAYAT